MTPSLFFYTSLQIPVYPVAHPTISLLYASSINDR